MKLYPLLIALLAAAFPAAAQRFVSKDVSDGLGNRKAYQLVQDENGYIWIYTQNSIDRYDGFEFRHYILPPEATEGNYLATSNTLSLDSDGVLNVVQTNGRIYRYNIEADALEQRTVVPDVYLYCVLFIGNMSWAGTSKGVIALDGSKTFIPDRIVNCLAAYGNKLYAGTDSGVYLIGPEGEKAVEGIPAVQITALKVLLDGRLYAGSFGDGAFCHYPRTGRCKSIPSFPHVPVRKIVMENDALLFGTDGGGIVVYDSIEETIRDIYSANDRPGDIRANTVSDLLIDKEGVLWASTTTDGICYRDSDIFVPQWLKHVHGDVNSLSSNHVNSVLEDSSGRLWFATNRGISRLDNGRWKHFATPAGADVVLTLAEDGDGTVWAGGYGLPVFSIDRKDRTKILDKERFQYCFSLSVLDGKLWIGGLNDSLGAWDLKKGIGTQYDATDIWDLFPGEELWVASNSGLGHISTADTGIRWTELPQQCGGAWCISKDSSGTLWVGLGHGGILSISADGSKMRTYPVDGTVFAIQCSDDGAVWAANGEHIFRIAPGAGKPMVMNRFLGISGPGEFNHTAARKLKDGRLVFGTANGALIFHPSLLDRGPMGAITPVLTSLNIQSADVEGILNSRSVNSLQKLVLPASAQSFAISFSALNLHRQARVSFLYQLKGYDNEPKESLSATTAEYNRIQPGSYIFEVKALDSLTGEELGCRSLPVRIRKPLWRTPWAFLLYALFLASLLFQMYMLQRRKKETRAANERIDNFISFAHDIKTPLTLIKAPLSDMELQETLSPESRESLKVARKNADRLMSMLNSLLRFRDFKEEEDLLELSSVDLEPYLESRIDEFFPAARSKGIAMEQFTDDGPASVLTDVRKLDMILSNLLSNALKYTEKGKISVRTRTDGSRWQLEVSDSGIGIPAQLRKYLFRGSFRADNAAAVDNSGYGIGLLITRQLAESLHGSIRYAARSEGGSRFILNFPLHYKEGKGVRISAPEPAPMQDNAADRQPDSAKASILIVEDDAEMLQYLSQALGQEYSVTTAANGLSAYEQVLEKNPDIVITDLVMPLMPGDELCRKIKGSVETSHIPVILVTALGEKEQIILGLESGADDYIVKPFDMGVLRARIRNILGRRSLLQAALVKDKDEDEAAEFIGELDRRFMEKVRSVIQANLSDPEFQVNDLCREMAMSRSSLFNKLKSLTGEGPGDYIRIFRLNKAKTLLESHSKSISEVADEVGFADAKYFSVSFKKQFGVSPSRV